MHGRSTPEFRARTAQWLRISGADLASRTSTACDKCFGAVTSGWKISQNREEATGNSENVTIKQETTVPARPRGPLPPHWHDHWGVLWVFQRSCPAKLQHSLNPVCTYIFIFQIETNETQLGGRWATHLKTILVYLEPPIISLKTRIKTKHTCEQYKHLHVEHALHRHQLTLNLGRWPLNQPATEQA